MRHIKSFALFEKEDFQEFLEDFAESLPGYDMTLGTMNFNTESPSVFLEIRQTFTQNWLKYTKFADPAKTIDWLRTNIDEDLFGETDHDVEESVKDLDFHDVDFEKAGAFLEDSIKMAHSYGLVPDRWYFTTKRRDHGSSKRVEEMIVIFKKDKKIAHANRGAIANRKFTS